jgi:hypothetical protein
MGQPDKPMGRPNKPMRRADKPVGRTDKLMWRKVKPMGRKPKKVSYKRGPSQHRFIHVSKNQEKVQTCHEKSRTEGWEKVNHA